MVTTINADYLVVGAGAAGMAFTDALVSHADVRVALVDRRPAAGGHWLDDYAFVRLHQASSFYGVASTVLGGGRVQRHGPEAGLHERATGAEVCAYYAQVLERMVASGRVDFVPNSDYIGERQFVSRLSGQRYEVREDCRIVDAHYLSPDIPSRTPAPFGFVGGVRVIAVNDLVDVAEPPDAFVIIGSGKTATDAIVWLLGQGVDPDAICWVRPREPWMLNRAVVQPDPSVFIGMAADVMHAAAASASADEMFLRLEDIGVMLRIDRSLTPTMAKAPTLGRWELDRLRQVERVVRRGHIRAVEPARLVFADGEEKIGRDAVVVHCAAPGLKYPTLVPIWGADAIRLQPVRAGFPCFGAAIIGYVEATRDDDAEKNRVCRPSPLADTPAGWCWMQALGGAAAQAFSAEPDIKAWVDTVALNPASVPPDEARRPEVTTARDRFRESVDAGLAACRRLAQAHGLRDSRCS